MILKSKLVFGLFLVLISVLGVYTLNSEGPNRILINLLAFAGIYAISAMGLNVHFGWTGLINFGHAAFMGVGAYTTILLIPHAAVERVALMNLAYLYY